MDNSNLVTVICTCYNQEPFVINALDSVLFQKHGEIELIIIDNGSIDGSQETIRQWLSENDKDKKIISIFHKERKNYCEVFNEALWVSKGKYLADLAADDYFYPNHLKEAVQKLENSDAGVYFCNAMLQKDTGFSSPFYPTNEKGNSRYNVRDGDVYSLLVKKYAICTATLVFVTELLKKEGVYDEKLTYEDFDILIRMSRKYPFIYHDSVGVLKRILSTSFASGQYRYKNSQMLPSTYKVCEKIHELNRSAEEREALRFRILHEAKHALFSANFEIAEKFMELAKKAGCTGIKYLLFRIWSKRHFDLSTFYFLWKGNKG
ncbi:MAG: glycosyltransferase [Cyclobacteriaceae bacterium]